MFGSQGARRRLSFGTGGTLLLTIAVFSAIYLYLERDGLIHFGRFPSLHGNHRCSLKSYTRHGFPVHCQGLYLDVGTNVGTQIRKLYNPEFFPGSRSESLFQSAFPGIPRSSVCTYGFEPNPQHDPWLQEVEKNLQCHQFNVKIFTKTAAHTKDGNMTFYRDLKTPEKYQEWGASLTNWQKNSEESAVNVATIDLASFVRDYFDCIYPRKIPVFMKMDVEGAEYGIMENMLSTGVLCQVSKMTIEWHPKMALPGINAKKVKDLIDLYAGINSCNFRILGGDDESYQTNSTEIPLNECKRS